MNNHQHRGNLTVASWALRPLRVCAFAGLWAWSVCHAAIATGGNSFAPAALYNGNGELFLVVFDDTARISYTMDLGIGMDAFWINAQQDYGTQQFWAVDDAQWQSQFIPRINTANLRWSVLATDTLGGLASCTIDPARHCIRLFTTVRQGDEQLVPAYTNVRLSAAVAGSKSTLYLDQVNKSVSHVAAPGGSINYTINGSGVIAEADNAIGYFGLSSTQMSTKIGGANNPSGQSAFDISNPVGQSSWFYRLSRSDSTNSTLNRVGVDEFDNLGHDGYFGFTYVPDNADSIYAGKYLLSYTLESVAPTATTAAGQLRMSFTDYSAGFASKLLMEAPLGEFAGYQPGSLVVPSPVPEPATWGLMGLGLLAVGVKLRRKQQAARA